MPPARETSDAAPAGQDDWLEAYVRANSDAPTWVRHPLPPRAHSHWQPCRPEVNPDHPTAAQYQNGLRALDARSAKHIAGLKRHLNLRMGFKDLETGETLLSAINEVASTVAYDMCGEHLYDKDDVHGSYQNLQLLMIGVSHLTGEEIDDNASTAVDDSDDGQQVDGQAARTQRSALRIASAVYKLPTNGIDTKKILQRVAKARADSMVVGDMRQTLGNMQYAAPLTAHRAPSSALPARTLVYSRLVYSRTRVQALY